MIDARPGVDPRLAPGEQPERDRRVEQADDDERPPVRAQVGSDRSRRRRAAGTTTASVERREPEPPEDQRRRLELPDGDLDEHERAAPDQGERPRSTTAGGASSRVLTIEGTSREIETRPRPPYTAPLSSVAEPLHRASVSPTGSSTVSATCSAGFPNDFELAVFSLLWSEHCGYKHSAPLLRRLPSRGERVLQGPGENAGVIDLGDGVAVAFKVESHNHPSAVEPFQGAATGVGGILRDIVAMGARPIALLDGLRFGAPDWHFKRAVAGIGHYGNCVGVPNVGGESVFDEAYAREPARERDVRRPAPDRARPPRKAQGAGNLARPLRRASPAATGSAAPRCSRARISRARTRSARRSRSATRSAARR